MPGWGRFQPDLRHFDELLVYVVDIERVREQEDRGWGVVFEPHSPWPRHPQLTACASSARGYLLEAGIHGSYTVQISSNPLQIGSILRAKYGFGGGPRSVRNSRAPSSYPSKRRAGD